MLMIEVFHNNNKIIINMHKYILCQGSLKIRDSGIPTMGTLCCMKKKARKKMTIILKIKERAEGKQTSEPENAHSTGECVIAAKFGDHVPPTTVWCAA